MSGLGEVLGVQKPLIEALVSVGWKHVPGDQLKRATEQPFVESEVVAALRRLNPLIDVKPGRVDEVLRPLRALTLATIDDGLVETNRAFAQWLRGRHQHEFIGEHGSVPVKLIDFDDPSNNSLVVSDEVTFGVPGRQARFDVVLWVNGFPLVVGELKSPVHQRASWMKGATELVEHYQPRWPAFFVPNAVVFATEGKEFMYAGVGTPVQRWETWGANVEQPKLADVLASARDMLAPRTVLDLLADFTLFEQPQSNDEAATLHKIIARYTQHEAVSLIVDRANDPDRRKGLIYHTQGSGKTLSMVFAAAKLLRDQGLRNPTIVLVADRVQLLRQLWEQFRDTGMPRLIVPSSAAELRRVLGSNDQRGLIFTTVHKFSGAPADLNTRDNVVVMIDEAHRTQEGDLGITMRAALPNATLFAFTGTPIAELARNTFATFGDEEDPGKALHTYDSDQSIADGMTVPIHVSPRMVKFALDRDALDEAFEQMVDQEGLSDDEAVALSRQASRVSTFFNNPERVRAVCADMIEHFYSTVDPLGMKAQVVVYDREACVAYQEELTRLLAARHETRLETAQDDGQAPVLDESAVVMTVGTTKNEDPQWEQYTLTEAQEETVLKRFRTHGDPLKFLVCTAKLGTGFNAPIEGVLYLDKPMKNHTLYQTITRTNRVWRNPVTGKDKRFGTIVDYVGLGNGFARAMSPANPDQVARDLDVEGLVGAFEAQLSVTMRIFAGIDHEKITAQTLMDAQARMPKKDDEERFAGEYLFLESIWEHATPHPRLLEHKSAYRFIAKVYTSIQPSDGLDDLIWQRLGAKTLELVHDHMNDIKVTRGDDVVVADAETIQRLLDEGLVDGPAEAENLSANDIIDSIAGRLKKRLAGENGDHAVYRSLAERLDKLREKTMAAAENSIEWLREAFALAKDVTTAEKAEDEAGVEGLDLLPDPNVGALTQIFHEFAPDGTPAMVERVVLEIDSIVREVRFDGWASTQKGDRVVRQAIRTTLKKGEMHKVPGLFDRAYDYITANY